LYVRAPHARSGCSTNATAAAAAAACKVVIAGAGGAGRTFPPAWSPAATRLPVIGVPGALAALDGLDSLLSIVQMPAGVPVATVAVGGRPQRRAARRADPGRGRPWLLRRMAEFQAELGAIRAGQGRGAAERWRTPGTAEFPWRDAVEQS
jgi:5-(carboxyamino)imidazole ribonucleotide mutase